MIKRTGEILENRWQFLIPRPSGLGGLELVQVTGIDSMGNVKFTIPEPR